MNTHAIALCVLVAAMGVAGRFATGTQFTGATERQLHQVACADPAKSDNPWNIKNLYDCSTSTLYIPYQLWTGAAWDGSKTGACMHAADATVAATGARIAGPTRWTNPKTGVRETVWSWKRAGSAETRYFTCHAKGIGRVYDSRGTRVFKQGRCAFPAGRGWALAVRRACANTAIEITAIALNAKNELESIEFNGWTGGTLDHRYRYAPNRGMTKTWAE